MSIFERAFLTVIADTMARLKAGDSQDAVRSFMDGRVRTLLASWNAVQALEAQLEDYADTWTRSGWRALRSGWRLMWPRSSIGACGLSIGVFSSSRWTSCGRQLQQPGGDVMGTNEARQLGFEHGQQDPT